MFCALCGKPLTIPDGPCTHCGSGGNASPVGTVPAPPARKGIPPVVAGLFALAGCFGIMVVLGLLLAIFRFGFRPDFSSIEDKGWVRTSHWWSGWGGEDNETDFFSTEAPWALEWEAQARFGSRSSAFNSFSIEVLDQHGRILDAPVNFSGSDGSQGMKEYNQPGTFRLKIKARAGSSIHRNQLSWRACVLKKK